MGISQGVSVVFTQRLCLVHQHDRDVVPDRIAKSAHRAVEGFGRWTVDEIPLAAGTDEKFEELRRNWHGVHPPKSRLISVRRGAGSDRSISIHATRQFASTCR